MILGRVYGSVVSTHKVEPLVGSKFMLVQCIENGALVDKFLVAVDGYNRPGFERKDRDAKSKRSGRRFDSRDLRRKAGISFVSDL